MVRDSVTWLVCLVAAGAAPVRAGEPRVTLADTAVIGNTATDQHARRFPVGGLSGIAHFRDDRYVAVIDGSDKLVYLTIDLAADGTIKRVTGDSGLTLADKRDFEAVAIERDTVLLCDEGSSSIPRYRLADGSRADEPLLAPPMVGETTRANTGLESLSLNSQVLWTCTEESLVCDGEPSSARAGTTVRLQKFTKSEGRWAPAAQYAYVSDPIHRAHKDNPRSLSRSGVSDVVALPGGQLLVLERSFALDGQFGENSDFRVAIYMVDFAGATDVSARQFDRGLAGQPVTPVGKLLLFSDVGNRIQNLEGLCLGPRLDDNRYALIGVVDNQKSGLLFNRVVSFVLTLEP